MPVPLKVPAIYALVKIAYKMILRNLLLSAIDDPDQEWDNVVLDILDNLFDYS